MASFDGKIVLLGNQAVGKTCLMDRFINDQYDAKYRSTVGAGFSAKKLSLREGHSVSVGIWDTAGDPRFAGLSKMYLKGVHAGVVCVCLHQPASYHRAKEWVAQLMEATDQTARVYIALTQCDSLVGDEAVRGVQQAFAEGPEGEQHPVVYGMEQLRALRTAPPPSVASTAGSLSSMSSLPAVNGNSGSSGTHLDAACNGAGVNVVEHAHSLAAYAALIKAPIFLTSARNSSGVKELFMHIAQDCARPRINLQRSESSSAASLIMALPFSRKISMTSRSPKSPKVAVAQAEDLNAPLLGTRPELQPGRSFFSKIGNSLCSKYCCPCGRSASAEEE